MICPVCESSRLKDWMDDNNWWVFTDEFECLDCEAKVCIIRKDYPE